MFVRILSVVDAYLGPLFIHLTLKLPGRRMAHVYANEDNCSENNLTDSANHQCFYLADFSNFEEVILHFI